MGRAGRRDPVAGDVRNRWRGGVIVASLAIVVAMVADSGFDAAAANLARPAGVDDPNETSSTTETTDPDTTPTSPDTTPPTTPDTTPPTTPDTTPPTTPDT